MKESTMKRIHFKADGTPYINLTNLDEKKRVPVDISDIEMLVESGLKRRQIAKLFSTTESAVSTALLCIRDYRANIKPTPAPKASAKIFPLVIPNPKQENPFEDCILFLEDGKFNGLETAKKFQKKCTTWVSANTSIGSSTMRLSKSSQPAPVMRLSSSCAWPTTRRGKRVHPPKGCSPCKKQAFVSSRTGLTKWPEYKKSRRTE